MNTQTAKITLTATMRKCRWFSGITAALTLFFFLSTFYFVPCAHAMDQAKKAEKARIQYHPQGRTDEEKLANTLQDIKDRVAEKKTAVHQRVEVESSLWQEFLNLFGLSALATEELDRLESMNQEAEKLNQKALEGFDKIEQDLIDKDLPEEILQRHYDAVEMYRDQYRRYKEKLQKAQDARSLQDQDSALGELDEFMGKQQFKRSQQPFDPDNLPFGTPDPKKTREPVTDPQELNRLLGLNAEPGVIEKVADALSTPAYADPVAGPTAADLAETIDVKITDAVKDLAAQLDNNPVKIYNWVRNNIDFIPTYGSIQGSEATLESKRGNAFDTSSLLIALLRAANIPAKYAYGTVRIPVDKVMNWVGGVEVPAAAQSILGQGGIPNIARVSGGQVEYIDMEHIWVEAWVDFEPSRGVNNIQGDSWVALDAGFKQFDYNDGIDIQGQVPFDAQGFADTLVNGATIDETSGSVQNIDIQFIQDQMIQYQQQANDFINTQAGADATVGNVLGTKSVRENVSFQLASALPYNSLSINSRFSEIPTNLRHKYRLTLEDEFGWALFSQTVDLPTIAGSTMAVSFRPATIADQQTLNSFMPVDFTDSSQLPNSFPGYLVNLEAEFVINNSEQATGAKFQMGNEVKLTQALYSPNIGWESKDSTIVAGEYHAIGVRGEGIVPGKLERLRDQMQTVHTLLEDCRDNNNCEPAENKSKHELIGTILQTGILTWFGITQIQDRLNARKQNVTYQPLPSFGKFGTKANVEYSWGIIPRGVSFKGFVMDIDFNKILVEADNADSLTRINFSRMSGIQGSGYEHLVPERLFSTAQNSAEGISAAKLLIMATDESQRIYTLTQDNIVELNDISIDADARGEIQSAVLAGKMVTVHDSPISAFGWTGSGYIIFDPVTGSGAYKISGGSNGGELIMPTAGELLTGGVGLLAIGLIGFTAGIGFVAFLAFAIGAALFMAAMGLVLIMIIDGYDDGTDWSLVATQLGFIVAALLAVLCGPAIGATGAGAATGAQNAIIEILTALVFTLWSALT